MAITATCPGCGASLSIDENQQSVTCQYCGNHFAVNLDETAPAFHKADAPVEPLPDAPAQPPFQDDYNPPIPGAASTAADDLYNPPIPGAPSASREDVYNPSLQDISSGSGQTYSPPPAGGTVEPPLLSRLMGNRLWVTIAIAAIVIFGVSCLCMVAIAGRIFQ